MLSTKAIKYKMANVALKFMAAIVDACAFVANQTGKTLILL